MTTENAIALTDPAREIVELCQRLIGASGNKTGDQYLADHFSVSPYSTDFFRIMAAIMGRFDHFEAIIKSLDFDTDFQDEMINHLAQIKLVFGNYGLHNQWASAGATRLSPENVQPLKALSPTVRQVVCYRRLTEEDVAAIAADATELLGWLNEANLADRDFIRGMLIDGLNEFLFRLNHFRWVGLGYTLDGLKAVIRAYLALEREGIDPANEPVAAAAVQKFTTFLGSVWEKTQTAREATDTADWALRMYVAYEAATKGVPAITALIGHVPVA